MNRTIDGLKFIGLCILGTIALIAIPMVLYGCAARDDSNTSQTVAPKKERFKVESQSVFRAGHGNNKREILIVTDTETGIQYLSITGCGTTELSAETKKVGKSNQTHTVEE